MAKSKQGISFRVGGVPEILDTLRGVKLGVGNLVLKGALRKQAGKTAKAAKAGVPPGRTGLLKRSIGYLYRKPRRSTGQIGVFVIGSRASVHATISPPAGRIKRFLLNVFSRGPKKKGPKLSKRVLKKFAGRTLSVQPWRYAHLVEGGRVAVGPRKKKVMSDKASVFGRDAAGVKGRPFMKPAAAMLDAGAMAEIAADVEIGLAREVAKYAKKGKSVYGTPGT